MFKIVVMKDRNTIVKSGQKRFNAITKEVQALAKQVASANKGYYTKIIPA